MVVETPGQKCFREGDRKANSIGSGSARIRERLAWLGQKWRRSRRRGRAEGQTAGAAGVRLKPK